MANNIKHQLFSGVFYTALAKYSGIIISLVVAGILARLLSPDDFGVVAIATVIIAFFNPKLYHPDSRRRWSNNCRALRSRFICADHQSYTFQHTDIRYFLSTLSATAAFHIRTESTPKDILLFGLSILV